MKNDKFILDEKRRPVPEPDLMKWARWYEGSNRVVASDMVGDDRVSTIFLGLDHQFGDGPPILWETIWFVDRRLNHRSERCSGSIEQAEAMHAKMVEAAKEAQK